MNGEQIQQDQSLNIHNPYYLHPRENPATLLVSPILDTLNYRKQATHHTIDRCDKKNGFPQNYATRGGRRNQGFGRGNSSGK